MSSENTKDISRAANLDYFELCGKVALITGASSGLGMHFSKCLAEAGCTVVLAARRKDKLDALAAQINSEVSNSDLNGGASASNDDSKDHQAGKGSIAHAIELDVSNAESSTKALSNLFETIGTPDILINNAGIARPGRFLDADNSDTDMVFNVNQTSVWRISQQVCKQMIEAGKPGSVINIASILGLNVMSGVGSYAISKAAVVQMTKVMALELARYKIRVNAIAPGYFNTEINQGFLDSDAGQKIINRVPFRRVGELDDLNGLLLLLASQKSSYMTGTVTQVDGGHLVAGLA